MVEFDVDLAYLAETKQLDEVRLCDENGVLSPLTYVLYERCGMEMDFESDEPIEGRWWHCDGCDDVFIYERGFRPSFCPECGRARV